MAWFSGTVEGANDVAIVLARLEDGSDQWTNASVTSRRNGYRCGAVVCGLRVAW